MPTQTDGYYHNGNLFDCHRSLAVIAKETVSIFLVLETELHHNYFNAGIICQYRIMLQLLIT